MIKPYNLNKIAQEFLETKIKCHCGTEIKLKDCWNNIEKILPGQVDSPDFSEIIVKCPSCKCICFAMSNGKGLFGYSGNDDNEIRDELFNKIIKRMSQLGFDPIEVEGHMIDICADRIAVIAE